MLDVNLTGTLLAVQAAGKQMVTQESGGSIVTIASIAVADPARSASLAYSVSKAGVWMLTKMAAMAAGVRGRAGQCDRSRASSTPT